MRVGRLTSGNWTEEMDSLLRELVAKNATKKEIMVAFPSKTYDALYRRMYKMKIASALLGDAPDKKHKWESIKRFKPPEIERKCLACGQPFMSAGPGNRLCMTHRRENDDGTFSVKIR